MLTKPASPSILTLAVPAKMPNRIFSPRAGEVFKTSSRIPRACKIAQAPQSPQVPPLITVSG